ncbi:low-density lipoprotein receptor-related protein 8-like [Eucyclogobius newberryi]|uniref:low-density lipoprotein receptor-related protein 8-like n=1 Tax=Eucyclogobius newberryi TaxID=166745 RepID=UPI003B5C708C
MAHLGVLYVVFLSVHSWDRLFGAPNPSVCQKHIEFRCDDGLCISRLDLCHGRPKCEDGSDERECGDRVCRGGEFFCDGGRCISVQFLCDGQDHCADGTDEVFCQNCTSSLSNLCLSKHQLCDGKTDCDDGRDEDPRVCGSLTSACSASEFECRDGQCIRHSYKCDNTADCSDASDEENCDVNECLFNNGGCPYVCVDEPQGFHCECPNNTRLVGDSQCEELNPCLEADVCDQLCFYTNGGLTCSCLEDHQKGSAAGECTAKGKAAHLFFSDLEGVLFTSIPGSKYHKLKSLHGKQHMTILASNNTLYWAQQGSTSIYRLSFHEKQNDAQLVLEATSSVSGLALDWIHSLLYWSSADTGSVHVSLLDGSVQRLLLTGLDKPCAVAVHPTQGVLFWAECGNHPKIEKSSLDGRYRKTLVNTLIHDPVALSLDMPRHLLYWVDQGLRRISRVNFEGHYRKTVVESNGFLDQPFGLALFEGFVYWSDEVSRSICRANKHDGRQFEVVLRNITSPGSLVISHPALQPNRQAACGHERCQNTCAVSATAQTLNISCTEKGQNGSEGFPVISRTVPASALSDSTFTGLLALTMILILLLLGLFLWWCREEVPSHRSFDHSLTPKESRDPLILDATLDPTQCLTKETLFKLDFE